MGRSDATRLHRPFYKVGPAFTRRHHLGWRGDLLSSELTPPRPRVYRREVHSVCSRHARRPACERAPPLRSEQAGAIRWYAP